MLGCSQSKLWPPKYFLWMSRVCCKFWNLNLRPLLVLQPTLFSLVPICLVFLPTKAVSGLLLNFKSEASVSTKVKVGNLRWTLISIEFNLILYSLIQLRSSRPLWPLDPSTRQASVHLAFPSCKGLTSSGSKKVWQDYFCLWQMLKFAIYLFLEGSAMVIFKLGKFSFSPSLDCFPLTGSALHPFLKDSRNIFINRRTRRVGLATMLIEHLNSDPKQL